MKFGDLCWIDIESADKNLIVVVPLASMEQHGHHSPLLTDTYLVTEVARRVELELTDQIYLLPTLWLGASDHHLDHPGTVSVPNSLYTQMIRNVTRSIMRAGFRRLFFLNGHGGNVVPGTQAITELVTEDSRYDQMWIALSSYWTIAGPKMRADLHGMESQQLSHAGEYETSMMLDIQPELIKMDRAKAPPPRIDSPFFHCEHSGRVNVAKRLTTWTPIGAMGKPQLATAEKGRSLFDAIAAEVINFVKDFATWE